MNCPLPQANGLSVEGREIGPGVYGIGQLWWLEDLQRWQCLAEVAGCLCIVEVKVRAKS